MRILVVGAGRVGAHVLQQLQKNPKITIITADPNETPYAVQEGIIEKVDIRESLTPLTLDFVVAQSQPELMILTRTSEDLGLGMAPGTDILAEALRDELAAISDVPVIEVTRTR
ncbi:MAG: NAD-binding protein [Chloroflexi bacterium]|nr:NAD-binding protein [Chloroflexota bacterium]MBL6965724.1 NAD-binding protein [Anaerolineales bacterium]